MPFAAVNDVQLYYELSAAQSGDAPTIIFINGIFQDTTSWALTVRAVAPTFRTLIYDCRGQGQSDKPQTGPYTPELHARDLAALLDVLHIERAHCVGLSNGGLVLMHFAKLFPARLRKLVCVDTFSHLDAVQQAMLHSWRAALEAGGSALRFTVSLPWTWGADFLAQNYDTIMALREKAAQLPTHSSIHLVDGALTHDARAWLGDIRAPTLVVQGTEDKMLSIEKAHALQRAIPNAQLHLIAGAGHAAWLEKATEFNQVLLEFLKREE
jgi:3-oxoadipate enol-lactonase